jgi:phage recombination protein Bet
MKALQTVAARMELEPQALEKILKATVFKGASNEEFAVLMVVADTYGLNPITKELYAFPSKAGGIVPVVSVDGWLRIVNDHPKMDGAEFVENHNDKGALVSVTCRIFRKDRHHPTTVTEYLAECRRNTEPWKMEHRMLRHKALKECARVAFGLGGIHDEDEAREIAEVEPKQVAGRVIDDDAQELAALKARLSEVARGHGVPLADLVPLAKANGYPLDEKGLLTREAVLLMLEPAFWEKPEPDSDMSDKDLNF